MQLIYTYYYGWDQKYLSPTIIGLSTCFRNLKSLKTFPLTEVIDFWILLMKYQKSKTFVLTAVYNNLRNLQFFQLPLRALQFLEDIQHGSDLALSS